MKFVIMLTPAPFSANTKNTIVPNFWHQKNTKFHISTPKHISSQYFDTRLRILTPACGACDVTKIRHDWTKALCSCQVHVCSLCSCPFKELQLHQYSLASGQRKENISHPGTLSLPSAIIFIFAATFPASSIFYGACYLLDAISLRQNLHNALKKW